MGGLADHEWAADARIRDVLDGLLGGVSAARFPQGLDTPIAPLSGGERRRIALSKLLLAGSDLLLLDEPTNHLDVEGVDWLAHHLRGRPALVVVTHDRWFLDAVCTRTWEVAGHDVHQYEGGYAAWVLARAERDRIAAATEERRRNLLRKELAWLQRGPPARTSKPRFRIDAANALIADEPAPRDRVELLKFATARLGKSVVDLEDVGVTLGERRLFRRLTWRLGPGDRVALVGVNGSGKTTLLRVLLGLARARRGHGAARLDRAAGVPLAGARGPRRRRARAGVARVGAAPDRARRRPRADGGPAVRAVRVRRRARPGRTSRDLSGGERRRLQLMRLLMGEPNLLVLDEPSNDLDIDTLLALEDLLDTLARHARRREPRPLSGRARVRRRLRDRRRPDPAPPARRHRPVPGRAPGRGAAAAAAGRRGRPTPTRGALVRQARRDASRLERELERLAARETELHALMAEHATDFARVSRPRRRAARAARPAGRGRGRVAGRRGPPRRLKARYPRAHVPQHPDPPQLRAARHRRRGARRRAAVRPQDQRLDEALAGQRRRLRAAVESVAEISASCSPSWSTVAPPKNREIEAQRARARAAERYGAPPRLGGRRAPATPPGCQCLATSSAQKTSPNTSASRGSGNRNGREARAGDQHQRRAPHARRALDGVDDVRRDRHEGGVDDRARAPSRAPPGPGPDEVAHGEGRARRTRARTGASRVAPPFALYGRTRGFRWAATTSRRGGRAASGRSR